MIKYEMPVGLFAFSHPINMLVMKMSGDGRQSTEGQWNLSNSS